MTNPSSPAKACPYWPSTRHKTREQAIERLRHAIEYHTRREDMFWLGEALLHELEDATPPTSSPVAPADGTADEAAVDAIVTGLYRRFKDWSKRGFGADDVTWCEVKADVIKLIAHLAPAPAGGGDERMSPPGMTPGRLDWLWFGEDEDGHRHISFGRWQEHACQYRYKFAEPQATEHDHDTPSPSPHGERGTLARVADAIDEARYNHPDNPRERPRPFSEADRGDREYALRLAAAAIRSLPLGEGSGTTTSASSAVSPLVIK